jgi:molybdate transport system substrate-binding protein
MTTRAPNGRRNHLHVFATGSVTGPLRRAAQAFVLLHEGATFEFTAAGAGKLLPRMLEWQEGDLICGGSEAVLDGAIMYGCVLDRTIRPVGARASAILVPNGNPAGIRGLEDLTRDDVRVGVAMQGSLEGIWEAVALRAGLFEAIRERVQEVATGSSDLMGVLARREIDASIGWTSAALLAPERIETVPITPELCSWRTTSMGVTPWTEKKEFVKFNRSPEGLEIWQKFGWQPLMAAKLDI